MIYDVFDDTAHFLEVLGVWLAAFATVLASLVALHVANRGSKTALEVETWYQSLASASGGRPQNGILTIQSTNVGFRPTTIMSVGIASWPFIFHEPLQHFDTDEYLPRKLADGEVHTYKVVLRSDVVKRLRKRLHQRSNAANKLGQWYFPLTLRASVRTSSKYEFKRPLPRAFVDALFEETMESQP